jgi:hypothetical protein
MKTIVKTTALIAAVIWLGACSAPTTTTSLEVTLSAPDPTTAEASRGVTYTITNADSTISTYEYDWKASFVATIQETGGLAVDITAVDLKLQQASGGIVIVPSGGQVEHYRFNSSASGNHVAANGTASIGFEVWYDLPNLGREALVTIALSFKDDDSNTYSKSLQVKVSP